MMSKYERGQHRDGGHENGARHANEKTPDIEMVVSGGLCGGRPFQQISMADENAPKRAQDGVGHQIRLIGEKREVEHEEHHGQSEIHAEGADVARQRNSETARHD